MSAIHRYGDLMARLRTVAAINGASVTLSQRDAAALLEAVKVAELSRGRILLAVDMEREGDTVVPFPRANPPPLSQPDSGTGRMAWCAFGFAVGILVAAVGSQGAL